MKLFKISAIIAFSLLSSACIVMAMYQPAGNMSQFEDFAARAMKVYHVPGASISIVQGGKLTYANGFGYRDIEHSLPVTPETIFGIGSCTKAFTATAVGMLVDQGKLDWDTPIKTYLPGLQMYNKELTENLSLRDCLCHRSGLPGYDSLWQRFQSRAELVANLRYLKPNANFREKYQYNNLMYALTGHVIETISGMPWATFVQENITKPLGMNNTYFSSSVVSTLPNAALAYEFNEASQSFKHVDYNNLSLIAPAGSIHSNVIDMAQWVIANLQCKGINSEVHKPQILMSQGEAFYYCFGWFRGSEGANEFVIHRGGVTGVSASVAFMPKEQTGVVVLTNIADVGDFTGLLTKYAHACITNNHVGMQECERAILSVQVKEGEEESLGTEQSFKEITTMQAAQFAGTYQNDLFGDFVISAHGTALKCAYTSMNEAQDLKCIDEDTLQDVEGWVFRFKRNASGQATSFDIDIEEGCTYEFIKV